MKAFSLALLCLFAAGGTLASAQSEPAPSPSPVAQSMTASDNDWHYSVTPYLWLPNINGNVNYQRKPILPNPPVPGNINVGVRVGPSDYLSNLNFAILVAFEARRKDFSVFGDYMNLNLSSNAASVRTISGPAGKIEIPISSSVSTHIFSGIFTLGAAYTVAKSDTSNLDVGLGFRNANLRTTTDYSLAGPITQIPITGSLSASVTLTDALLIARGRLGLGGRWYAPYYGDIGTGNSNTTWQYVLGVAYGGRTNDVIFAWRGLGYNQNNGQLLQNMRFSGPLLGYRIHW